MENTEAGCGFGFGFGEGTMRTWLKLLVFAGAIVAVSAADASERSERLTSRALIDLHRKGPVRDKTALPVSR